MYRANNISDLRSLAADLNNLPLPQKIAVGAHLLDAGLMRMSGVLLGMQWLLKRARGYKGAYAFMIRTSADHPQQFKAFWEDTSNHILNGKDTEDTDSVGGYSQREVNMIDGWIKTCR